jgi:hypothetical protein
VTIKIDARLSRTLLEQPETGMGYQIVEVRRPGAPTRHAVIANATDFIKVVGGPRYVREVSELDIRRTEFELKYPSAETAIRVLKRDEAARLGLQEARERKGRGAAKENPVEDSLSGEKFLRFSAYDDDPRILPDGSVKKGTYVTTLVDGEKVKTGTEAVERYALPNPEPAVHRFHLQPPPPRTIVVRRGTVQPDFGHEGGGDEVIFEDGASGGTYRGERDRLPRGDE